MLKLIYITCQNWWESQLGFDFFKFCISILNCWSFCLFVFLKMNIYHTCQPQNFEKRKTFLWVNFYLSCPGCLKISVLAAVSVWQCSGVSMTGCKNEGWQHVHYKNRLKQSVRCLIFVLQGWRINPFEFSNNYYDPR